MRVRVKVKVRAMARGYAFSSKATLGYAFSR
jgi:hypothetical protein